MIDADIETLTPDRAVEKMLIDLAALVEDQALELAAANARIAKLEGALRDISDPTRLASQGDPTVLRYHARAALKDQPE